MQAMQTFKQEPSAKLLGINIEETLKWKSQINGKGGVVYFLNQCLYLIRCFKNQENIKRLQKIADCIWSSEMKYGLQLYHKGNVNWGGKKPNIVSSIHRVLLYSK